MIDTFLLEKRIIDFCRLSNRAVSKEQVYALIDSLPEIAEPYFVQITIKASDLDSFSEFLILNGFGSGQALNGCCSSITGEEIDGIKYYSLLFDTSRSMNCEFILKDCLLRRYNVSLDSIQLKDNIKLVKLSDPKKRRYDVVLNVTYYFQDTVNWTESANALRYYATDLMKSKAHSLFADKKGIKSYVLGNKVTFPETVLVTDNEYEIKNGIVTFTLEAEITTLDSLPFAIESAAKKFIADLDVDHRFKLSNVKLIKTTEI